MKKFIALMLALLMAVSVTCALADGIKISTIGPLTGPYAIYGTNVAYAIQIAVDEINAKGGIQFEYLTAQDDQGDPTLGVNAYNALMDDGMQILVGNVTSGACIAVGSEAFNDRTFLLTPSASNDLVTADKDNVFQICFTDSNQGKASAQYIAAYGLAKKVGIIYNNAIDYSMGIRNTFVAEAAVQGLEIVAEATFSDDNNADFSVQVNAMKEAGAELVFLPIYYTPASNILSRAKTVDYAPIFFGVDGMDGILTMEGFDPSLAEGVMLLTPFSASSTDPVTAAFVAKYQETYNDIPNQFAADAYDAVYVLSEICEIAGITPDTDPAEACEKLIAAITAEDYHYAGITGDMQWAKDGTVNKLPQAVTIVNGEYVLNE